MLSDCMCTRLASDNRGHHWVLPKKGADLYREWRVEQVERDAEAMAVLAYTDCSGCGTAEVVNNMVLDYLLLLP